MRHARVDPGRPRSRPTPGGALSLGSLGLCLALINPGPAVAGGPVHIEDSLFNIYGSPVTGFTPQNYSNTRRGTSFVSTVLDTC